MKEKQNTINVNEKEEFLLQKNNCFYNEETGFTSTKMSATVFSSYAEASKRRKKLYKNNGGTIFIIRK